MEKYSKNNNINFNNSLFFNNYKGINYDYYINQQKNKNISNKEKKNAFQEKTNFPIMNMNSLYTNMIRFNYMQNNMNFLKPMSTRINSLLIDFNKSLSKENITKEENKQVSKNDNINNNNLNEQNFGPLIKKLESQEDERFKKSRFLQFIKDINSKKLIINEEKNIIEQNVNYINKENEKNKIENSEIENEKNELEELLKEAKIYMDYSKEDLAQNILERIFDNSKIRLKENKKYLEKAFLFLIICYFNLNEDLLGISLTIDLLNLIEEENVENSYKFLYGKEYISKEYIEKINQRNFDITDKEQYDKYINEKKKIHEEIENYIKNKIINNKNESYNQLIFLLYGLILYLNEKYNEAEEAFNQLIILDNNNYFYYNTLGVIYVNQKKFSDSLKCYKKAIEMNSEYPKCLINLGVLLSNKGEYKESCKYLISALKIFDDIPEGWNYLLSNIIELNEDDLIFEINNRNLKTIEENLFKK